MIRQSPQGTPPGPGWPSGNVNGQVIDYGMDPDVVNDARYKDLMDDALLAIPSISLVTKLDNLFGAQSGIYTHPGSEGRTWERPVSIELLNPDGSEGFQIDARPAHPGRLQPEPAEPQACVSSVLPARVRPGQTEVPSLRR